MAAARLLSSKSHATANTSLLSKFGYQEGKNAIRPSLDMDETGLRKRETFAKQH